MKQNKPRPVNLDIPTMHFPLTALASIAHRITGVVTFVGIACLLWLLRISLFSEDGFLLAKDMLSRPWVMFFLWGFLTLFFYHLVGGVRHIIMDFGFFEEKDSGARSVNVAVVVTAIFSVLVGSVIW